jgi:poly-gamma-glutamate synthesis protein (capsule biosynthesis protein)
MTKKRWVVFLLLIIVVIAVDVLLWWRWHSHHKPAPALQNVAVASVEKQTPAQPSQQKLSSRMLFVGEVFWGRGIEYYAKKSPLGYAFPFSGLAAADKQDFDAWVGDMECPITSKDIPYQTQVDNLLFNCRPEYVPEAAKWFDALTLANNHTNNNDGAWGIDQTRKNLEANKIQYFGDYNMQNLSNICEVIAMPAQLTVGTNEPQKTNLPVALCGYDYVGNVATTQAQLDVMKKFSAVMPVVAMPHMGVEYRPTAEDAKVSVYRKLIDNGADVVIGAHPHVVQNSESYKGRLIEYSTGNFMFDQQSLGKDTILSLGVGLKLDISDAATIAAYQSATNCRAFQDDCLAQLAGKVTKRPTISVAYSSRCFEQSSNIPRKANQAVCDDILNRATWQSSTASLSPTW